MGRIEKGNFAEGKISSNVLRLSFPILMADMVQILYNLVDRMFIGHIPGYGTQALTGIGIVFPLITIIAAFSNLCSFGGSSICSIARGQKNDIKAREIMETAFTLVLLYSVILTAVVFIFQKPILFALGADDRTFVFAKKYADIYFLGTPLVLLANGMNSFINLQGFATMGMLTVLIGAALNIILDPVFIFVLDMGVEGAAIATVIAQFASALWICLFLTSKRPPLRITGLRFNIDYVKQIHKLGISGFAFKSTTAITQAVANSTLRVFGGAMGSMYIAAMSIITQLREVTFLPINAITEGAKPVMSYNYGAKEYKRAEKTIWFMFKLDLALNLAFWAMYMTIPHLLVRIFSSDEVLISVCIPAMRIYFCSYFMMTFQIVGQNAFVALNKPKFALFFSIFRKLILILPFTLILPRVGFGVNGVFWAEVISQIIGASCAFTTMYFTVVKKLRKDYLLLPR